MYHGEGEIYQVCSTHWLMGRSLYVQSGLVGDRTLWLIRLKMVKMT